MGNTHAKRKQRAARLAGFAQHLNAAEAKYEVTQHTKYHYSFQRLLPDGFLTDPVQAYPTTLRIVTYDGTTINCLTISEMYAQIETELYRDA
jgi:hypothetical protein